MTGDELVHVVGVGGGAGGVGIDEGVEVFGGIFRGVFCGVVVGAIEGRARGMTELRDEGAQTREAEVVVGLLEVDGAGDLGVHGGAA